MPPKSAVGKAIGCSLGQWPKRIRYINHGDLNIDNNRAEGAIKPFVIGRKNGMFANTANGANPRAILYSLIETAKANGLTPFDDIKHLLDELSRSYRGTIEELSRNYRGTLKALLICCHGMLI